MAVTIDSGERRPVIIYIVVAIILLVALLLGVRWVKNRAVYYAQAQNGQSQQQPATDNNTAQSNSGEQPVQDGQEVATNPGSQPQPSSQSTTQTPTVAPNTGVPSPAQVPSTGAEQLLLPLVSLSAFIFAGISYLRTRRKLQSTL